MDMTHLSKRTTKASRLLLIAVLLALAGLSVGACCA